VFSVFGNIYQQEKTIFGNIYQQEKTKFTRSRLKPLPQQQSLVGSVEKVNNDDMNTPVKICLTGNGFIVSNLEVEFQGSADVD